MHDTELNTVAATLDKFPAIAEDLPPESEQAWNFSSYYIECYLREHADNGTCLGSQEVALFAAGRLEWLLLQTRSTLSGLLTEQDVIALLDCYQGSMFCPDQMNGMASDLCDHLGVKLSAYETSSVGPLIDKLRGMSAAQRVALADALEQTWHRGMCMEQKQPREFLASMGIVLM